MRQSNFFEKVSRIASGVELEHVDGANSSADKQKCGSPLLLMKADAANAVVGGQLGVSKFDLSLDHLVGTSLQV